MRADVVRLEMGLRWRSTVGYCLGLAAYVFAIVALYPSFRHDVSLDNLTRHAPTVSALFGAVGSVTSPTGWLEANIYANFFPLVMLMLTIGYGASSFAGRDEDGTLALITTLPLSRRDLVLQRVAAMVAQGFGVAAATAVVVVVGRPFDLTLPVGHVLGASGCVLLLAVDFGLVAMAVGARTGRKGTALGAGSALAAASYLVSSLAPVVSWVRPARFVSLFFWSVDNGQLSTGPTVADVVLLAAVGAVATTLAIASFARMDVH